MTENVHLMQPLFETEHICDAFFFLHQIPPPAPTHATQQPCFSCLGLQAKSLVCSSTFQRADNIKLNEGSRNQTQQKEGEQEIGKM